MQKQNTNTANEQQTITTNQTPINTPDTKQNNTASMSAQTNYVSNPFKVVFDGLGNMFNLNKNMSIILLIASLFMSSGNWFFSGTPSPSNGQTGSGASEQMAIIFVIFAIIILLLSPLWIFLYTMYTGMAAYTALSTSKQKTITFKEAWTVTLSKFWVILGINIIVLFKIFFGILLFIIPGIRAILRYNMVLMFVFDENTKVFDSINKSKELSKDHLMEIYGMSFLANIIPIIGGLAAIGGQSFMYPQLRQLKSGPHKKPDVHWLNYIGVIFLVLIFILIAFILILVMLIAKK